MASPKLQIVRIVSFPFDENTYVAWLEGRNDCLVFDPGLEPDKILDLLEEKQLVPAAIVLTHGHSDHIGGNATLSEKWPKLPIVIGRGDAPKLTDPVLNLSAPFGLPFVSPPADKLLDEGDRYEAAGLTFDILHLPGHCCGHIGYVFHGVENAPIVFGGDVLFRGSVGRSDFPDGDFAQLESSIQNKLYTMPDETVVLPGHGPATTIGEEKRSNPFVRPK